MGFLFFQFLLFVIYCSNFSRLAEESIQLYYDQRCEDWSELLEKDASISDPYPDDVETGVEKLYSSCLQHSKIIRDSTFQIMKIKETTNEEDGEVIVGLIMRLEMNTHVHCSSTFLEQIEIFFNKETEKIKEIRCFFDSSHVIKELFCVEYFGFEHKVVFHEDMKFKDLLVWETYEL